MLERYSEEGQFREGSVHAMRTSWKERGTGKKLARQEEGSRTNSPNGDFATRIRRSEESALVVSTGPHGLFIWKDGFGNGNLTMSDDPSRPETVTPGPAGKAL